MSSGVPVSFHPKRTDTDQALPAVVSGALRVPAVSVKGTRAEGRVSQVVARDIVEFQALVRLYVPAILDQAGSATKNIDLPMEFVFLDIE